MSSTSSSTEPAMPLASGFSLGSSRFNEAKDELHGNPVAVSERTVLGLLTPLFFWLRAQFRHTSVYKSHPITTHSPSGVCFACTRALAAASAVHVNGIEKSDFTVSLTMQLQDARGPKEKELLNSFLKKLGTEHNQDYVPEPLSER
ncbi:hypothetical protein Anapl_14364 [Anas platyrhynchos]|uniref:Uncharacterized protein n=1 Tax=Anas platyrhynchos TaxID=8839 RepID=R0LLD6_ANAPL|nr:hypothetical protein Anapl_14364 [Anas platyrhynchos]